MILRQKVQLRFEWASFKQQTLASYITLVYTCTKACVLEMFQIIFCHTLKICTKVSDVAFSIVLLMHGAINVFLTPRKALSRSRDFLEWHHKRLKGLLLEGNLVTTCWGFVCVWTEVGFFPIIHTSLTISGGKPLTSHATEKTYAFKLHKTNRPNYLHTPPVIYKRLCCSALNTRAL